MDEYAMKFYKNGEEIELSEMPKEYLSGIIEVCKAEIVRENRWERVCQNIAKDISDSNQTSI